VSLVTSLAGRAAKVALIGPALERIKSKISRILIGGVLVGLLSLLGFIFLLAAARGGLDQLLGPTWSPLLIGVALCAAAGAMYLVFLRPRPSEEHEAKADGARIRHRFMRPARRVENEVGSRPILSTGAALVTGFAAAFLLRFLRRRSRRARANGQGFTWSNGHEEWDKRHDVRR
jgi:hypothetical protein